MVNPAGSPAIVEEIKQMVASGLPLLGIGLGHQFLGLALGAAVKRMPVGHHGGNQPVREIGQRHSLITAQSHSFVLEVSEKNGGVVTHVNLNDRSVEGLRCRENPRVFSVQYIPQRDENGRPDPVLQRFVESLS